MTHCAREFSGGKFHNGIIFWAQFFVKAVFRGAYFLETVFQGEFFVFFVAIIRSAISLGCTFPPARLCDIKLFTCVIARGNLADFFQCFMFNFYFQIMTHWTDLHFA